MKKYLLSLTAFFIVALAAGLLYFYQPQTEEKEEPKAYTWQELRQQELALKKERRANGYVKLDQPDEFVKYHRAIRTRDGETEPGYQANYRLRELEKAFSTRANFRTKELDWVSRGPGNVPGRTRSILAMPSDPLNVWIAGSVGGGIWKTTDGGDTWDNKSEDFPTLAVTTLAYVESNPDIIYAGTGEHIASAGTAIRGDGLFKSIDGGDTWTQIPSTAGNPNFTSVTRVIVDPNNENIILASTAENTWDAVNGSQIMRSTDGGASWTKVYSSGPSIDQILFSPDDFNVQYAAVNGSTVIKSTDAGLTWSDSGSGLSFSGRAELVISPVNTSRIFASTEGQLTGTGSDLYVSDDAGANWVLVSDPGNNQDFLGGQGWYDNTIVASPFNEDVVYFGGVNLWRNTVTESNTTTNQVSIDVDESEVTSFWDVVSFSNGEYYRNGLSLGSAPEEDFVSIEFRFGPGVKQFAHRFTVPAGATSGVPPSDFTYQDYIEVPFQVWDTDNNRQLMVSFRDQAANGVFDLVVENLSGSAEEQSREYVYIHTQDYSETESPTIAVNAGIDIDNIYFITPKLRDGATWDPDALPDAKLIIDYSNEEALIRVGDLDNVSDAYLEFDNINTVFGNDDIYAFHPDHHVLVAVPVDEAGGAFMIINGSDGGVYVSNTSRVPGTQDGDWTFKSFGYNTSQFYGADKKPGANEYIGGMQDQGTWKSPVGEDADEASLYNPSIGGDGFQVLWNSADPRKVIGGSQGNNFARTLDDGETWINATSGLSGSSPFISKLANSTDNPDVIFTVTSDGVFRSDDFGGTWTLTPINSNWGASTFNNVKVSLADYNTVWAGQAISGSRRLHVSTDGGETFTETSNYNLTTLGTISGLETHPTDPQTAYALFSFAGGPKVLRTTDLGQTWEDISGFGANSTSSNGFPDVAVYSLLVLPHEPNTIWVGTDIGMFESTDNGTTWHIADNGFPAAAVWQMKVVDDQIVVATHGRGIWSYTVPELTATLPDITFNVTGTTPKQEIIAEIAVDDPFDSVKVFIDGEEVGLLGENTVPVIYTIRVSGITDFGTRLIRIYGYKDGEEFRSFSSLVDYFEVGDFVKQYENEFDNTPLDFLNRGIRRFTNTGGITNGALHTLHPYEDDNEAYTILTSPVIVEEEVPFIFYKDIALVQPGDEGAVFGDNEFKDYVVVEGSRDGINWLPLEDGYDASADPDWAAEFPTATTVSEDLYREHMVDITSSFAVGDTIFVRFRLFADSENNGFGWVIDNLFIQQEPLSLENFRQSNEYGMVLYPNPVINYDLHIEYNSIKTSKLDLEVIDFSGKVLEKQDLGILKVGRNLIRKNMSSYPSGTYLIRLSNSEITLTERVILQ